MKKLLSVIFLFICVNVFGQNSQPFLRTTLTNLRSQTKAIPGVQYYITDAGREGEFFYDPADNTSSDNGGTVIVGNGLRYKRRYDGFVNLAWFGADLTGTNDCSAAITAGSTAAFGNTLFFPRGTYKLTTQLNINLVNTNWLGQDSTTVITGNYGYTLLQLTAFRNATIKNICFNNQYVNSVENGLAGCIYTNHIDVVNTSIDNCWFTNPGVNTDAINLYTNIGDTTLPQRVMYNIDITNNHFINIGRIAVDIFNRKYDAAGRLRARNIHVDNNFADSLGIQGSYGLFVSFDGTGYYNTCNGNYIKNAFKAGIEMNYDNSQIIGNTFEYTSRAFIPIEVDPTVPVYGFIIANNTMMGANTYSTYFNLNNSQIYGNTYLGSMSTSAGDGILYLTGCNNNSFTGEKFISTAGTLRLSSMTTVGSRYYNVPCTNNAFRNCYFINTTTGGINSRCLISADSGLTSGNVITQCHFTKGNDSAYFRQVQGANNNYVYDNYHDGVLTNFNTFPYVNGVGNVSATANTKGMDITNGVSSLHTANATNPGILSAGPQFIGGNKTFPDGITLNPISQFDTTSYKPLVIDGSGNVFKSNAWYGPGGVGGGITDANNGLNVVSNVAKLGGGFTSAINIAGTSNASFIASSTGTNNVNGYISIQGNSGASLNSQAASNGRLATMIADAFGVVSLSSNANGTGGSNSSVTLNSTGVFMSGNNYNMSSVGSKFDTTTYKPVIMDASGNIFKSNAWYGPGGSSSNIGLLYAMMGITQATNTTSVVSLMPSGVGSSTLPANTLTSGKVLRLHLEGTAGTQSSSPGNFTISFLIGGTTVGTATITNLTANIFSEHWEMDYNIQCPTPGTSGTVYATGAVKFANSVSQGVNYLIYDMTSINAVTINTTTTQTLDVRCQWATGSTSNSWKCYSATLEALN
jgi:hypothetical protein